MVVLAGATACAPGDASGAVTLTGFEVSTSTAEAEAFQNSTVSIIDGSSFVGTDAQGTADTFVLASQQDLSEATATSDFVIQFSIPAGESYNYTLSGDIARSGQSGVEIYLDRLLPLYEEQFYRTGNNPGHSTRPGRWAPARTSCRTHGGNRHGRRAGDGVIQLLDRLRPDAGPGAGGTGPDRLARGAAGTSASRNDLVRRSRHFSGTVDGGVVPSG